MTIDPGLASVIVAFFTLIGGGFAVWVAQRGKDKPGLSVPLPDPKDIAAVQVAADSDDHADAEAMRALARVVVALNAQVERQQQQLAEQSAALATEHTARVAAEEKSAEDHERLVALEAWKAVAESQLIAYRARIRQLADFARDNPSPPPRPLPPWPPEYEEWRTPE